MADNINRTVRQDDLLNNKLYVQYSHDIEFDYSGGKYPNGTEADWDWENIFIPVTHKIGSKTVSGHSWRRERIGNTAWGLPTRMVASPFKIDASGQTVPSPENLIEGYTFLNESTGQIYIVSNSEWTGPYAWRGETSGIFYKQDTQPTGVYVGDTWNNTSTDTLWRFDGTNWVLIELSGSVQDLALGDLSNVVLTNSTTGEVLMFNGTNWTNQVIDSFPDQTGNTGKFLQTDGSDVSWQEVPDPITLYNGDSTIPENRVVTLDLESTLTIESNSDVSKPTLIIKNTGDDLTQGVGIRLEVYDEADSLLDNRTDIVVGSTNTTITSLGGIVVDTANAEGIKYDADYSLYYTDRSLVDKAWVVANKGVTHFDISVTNFNEFKTAIETNGYQNILIAGNITFTSDVTISAGKNLFLYQAELDYVINFKTFYINGLPNNTKEIRLLSCNIVTESNVNDRGSIQGGQYVAVESCYIDLSLNTGREFISGTEVNFRGNYCKTPPNIVENVLIVATRTYINDCTFDAPGGTSYLYLQGMEQCNNVIFTNYTIAAIIETSANNIRYTGTGLFYVGQTSAVDSKTIVNNLVASSATSVRVQAGGKLSNFEVSTLYLQGESKNPAFVTNGRLDTLTTTNTHIGKITNCKINNTVSVVSGAKMYFMNCQVGNVLAGAKTITFNAGSYGSAISCTTEATIVDNSGGTVYIAGNDLVT